MKIKSARDFWSGLLFLVVGVVFAIAASRATMGPPCAAGDPCERSLVARFAQLSAAPGTGFFPLGLGIVLALVGAVVLFKSLTIESDQGDPVGTLALRPLVAVVAAVVLFAVAVAPLGLVLAVPLAVVVSTLAAEEFDWKNALVQAAALTVLACAIVRFALHLAIPLWPALAR